MGEFLLLVTMKLTPLHWAILILALVAAVGHTVTWLHDVPLLVTAALLAAFFSFRRPRLAIFTGVVLVPLSLYWSALDVTGCSAWWRGGVVVAKMSGELPYVSWGDVGRAVGSRCYGLAWPHPQVRENVHKIEEKRVNGWNWERYKTALGKFWIPAPGLSMMNFLIWEITIQRVYESGDVSIQPGDTVVDCGAHVGVFTRYALSRGAGRVIAIEPEPANIACFESNFANEITAGRVLLVKAGVWDHRDEIPLRISPPGHSGSHRF